MRYRLAFCLLALSALPLAAQDQDDDGGGRLERFLENRLSQAGRDVNITGFRGALSSQATLQELTIADEEGVWLTLRGAELDWSRASLLRGRVQVEALTADEIILARLPEGGGGPSVRDSEAQPFQLPELPVSIQIGRLATERLELGAPVLGQEAEMGLEAALRLAGGAGSAQITATRVDAEARYTVDASYANDTRQLALDLDLAEASNGLIGSTLGLPGAPPVELTAAGAGPLSDFAADLALATDGVERVTGRVTLAEPEDSPGIQRFALDLSGDVGPLVADRLRPFFGAASEVRLAGLRRPDGGTEIDRLDLTTGALSLTGTLALAPTGLPERLALDGTLAGPVALPLSGPETRVDGARLTARFDESESERWQAELRLDGLNRAGLRLGGAELAGAGTIRTAAPAALTANLSLAARGLSHEDPALAEALGEALSGRAQLDYRADAPLRLESLSLDAGGATALARGTLGDVAAGLPLDGSAEVALDDLARLAPLAGRDLGGAATARIEGRYGLLDGIFDLVLSAHTRDLATGTPQLDPLLAGDGRLAVDAERGPGGTTLRALELRTAALRLDGEGALSTAGAGFTLTGAVTDLGRVDPRLSGPARLDTRLAWEDGGRVRIDRLEATGAGARLTATGALTPDDPALPAEGEVRLTAEALAPFSGLAGRPLRGALDATLSGAGAVSGDFEAALNVRGQGLAVGIAEVDRLLAGEARVAASLSRAAGALTVGGLDLSTDVLTFTARDAGGGALDISGRLSDLALVAPGFPGPLSVSGRAQPTNGDVRLDLDATGPGGTTAQVRGSVARDLARADLQVAGAAPLALVNGIIAPRSLQGQLRYDLALRGPLALTSLSGRLTTSGGRVSVPTLNLALTDVGGRVDLSSGRARIDLGAAIDGGRLTVSGPVTLAAPFPADLSIALTRARLRDPNLYETRLDGRITVSGPLTGGARIGGRIDLGRTEVSVPSTGVGAGGPIPEIAHRGETAAQRATRARAGLLARAGDAEGGGGTPYPLDLTISAPGQVFVRGRGLDAELGGVLRLRGTTADVIAEGRFDLIRGHLDILARRFTLAEGRVSLQGALDPYLRFVAETEADDITAQIVIEGRASAPEVRFLSQPELPEDEVLARILFGRGIEELSPVQAVQLASSVASLAGGGGGGLLGRVRANTGLDEIDVRTTEDGQTEVTVGKYLTENVYSEVTVDEEGKSQINLNLDVIRNVTIKGSVDDAGDTGIGIFYERDY
ncbi:autotransporter secretion inner membrane protein TamB [Rhodovulum sp. ES.010]|uniref:translocation/assembly module TamB domain-containing protein n=1 Tax=Rhodovulum sp. ES.010 TaxID=1882821 RepID=UPI00092B720D|nr:translocation/assembly module TamB domain-containing protein [Rhodovulum sp. ES.010]SIO23251.1 autotransporter secretion inner membrane protein TamB [Rhodovulum sp. ES.010]